MDWNEPSAGYLIKVITQLKHALKENQFERTAQGDGLQLESLKSEIANLNKENKELKLLHNSDDQSRGKMFTELNNLKNDLMSNLKKATASNKKLKEDYSKLLKEVDASKNLKIENSELRALKRENERMENLISIEKQALNNFKLKNKKLQEDNSSLEQQLDKLKKENTKVKLRIKSLEMELESAKRLKKMATDADARSVGSKRSVRSLSSQQSKRSYTLSQPKPKKLSDKKVYKPTSTERTK